MASFPIMNQFLESGGRLRRLLTYLPLRRRWQLVSLWIAMFCAAAAELATFGAVAPFLSLLADPAQTSRYPFLQSLLHAIGRQSGDADVILAAATVFAIVAMCAAAVRMFVSWLGFKSTFDIGADIGAEVYRRTLYQPYKFHIFHNTSEIIAGLNKTQTIVAGVISPLIQSANAVIVSVAILIALIYVDAVAATWCGVGFTLIYLAVTVTTGVRLRANSKMIAENEVRRVQAVQEGLGGIRDILLDGAQEVYIARFMDIERARRSAQAANYFISGSPRHLIESVGMILIVALAYWLSLRPSGLSEAVPVLGALAIGAQRLLPQMQMIYFCCAALNANASSLTDVVALLEKPLPENDTMSSSVDRLDFKSDIILRDVTFRYHDDSPDAVRNVSLRIRRGDRVGFIGATGSGKSTLIDLITGLLEPTSGVIEVDGRRLGPKSHKAWQRCIAHVPQSIYLADATIAENIAFGADVRHIDMERVRMAAKKAQVDEFIDTLPNQYQTLVGERGVRLSGGQRQRIGLTRALYKQTDILILDEATSALDDATENAVMRGIESLSRDVTVLVVAHRISTLRDCDIVLELKDGHLVREARYHELDYRPSSMSA